MSTVLYIKASPRADRSYSVAVADAFVESYHKSHTQDEIKTIDIFTTDLPEFDLAAATAKYKIMHGKEHSQEDKQIWERIILYFTSSGFKIIIRFA